MTKEERNEYNHKYYLENKDKINKHRAKKRDKINEYSRKYYSQKKQKLAELENKIADIKANCDLAIEGRDIKIKELEQELTIQKDLLQEEINLHLHAEEYIKSLEQQIEKMRNCVNCKYRHCDTSSFSVDKDGNKTFHSWNEEKERYCDTGKNGEYQCWEIKE